MLIIQAITESRALVVPLFVGEIDPETVCVQSVVASSPITARKFAYHPETIRYSMLSAAPNPNYFKSGRAAVSITACNLDDGAKKTKDCATFYRSQDQFLYKNQKLNPELILTKSRNHPDQCLAPTVLRPARCAERASI